MGFRFSPYHLFAKPYKDAVTSGFLRDLRANFVDQRYSPVGPLPPSQPVC